MDFINNDENPQLSISQRISKGAWLSVPVILTGALLLSLSYIIDIIFAGGAELGIGETTAVAKVLYGTGTVINKLIPPFVAGGVALYVGGLPALAGGLIGGMLTGMGVTLDFSSGNTAAVTGVFGSLLAGLVAGYTVRLTDILLNLLLKKPENIKNLLSPIVSIVATIVIVFLADSVSQLINGLASIMLAAVGEFSKLLLVLLLSVMITADIGGPLYLASLVYAVASIATDEPQIMAAVTAAGSVPALSICLTSLIFRDRFSKNERTYAGIGAFCGLCGISQVAIPFYATRLHRVILPCITGGAISGTLSFLLGCNAITPAGGFLSISGSGTLLYFLLSVTSGVLFSSALMGYMLQPLEDAEISDEKESKKQRKLKRATA